MKVDQLRNLSVAELTQKLHETEEELFNLRFRKGMQQELPDPLRIRVLRRDVARMKTMLREHELGLRKLAQAGTGTTADRPPREGGR
jgi:large subunit ribosomal protein L29